MVLTNHQLEEWLKKLTERYGQPYFAKSIAVVVKLPSGAEETVKLEAAQKQEDANASR